MASFSFSRPIPFLAGLLIVLASGALKAQSPTNSQHSFDSATGTITDVRWKSGLPLGGIGVGKIELLTDGSFGNFTINHNWDRPYGWAKGAFAAVREQAGTGVPVARMLRLTSGNEYQSVSNISHTGMLGWFPRAAMDFSDDGLPVKVHLDAFSPLIPHDPRNSGLPVACLSYTLTNPTTQTVHASLLLAWPNLLGWGGKGGVAWSDLGGDSQTSATAGALTGLRYTTTQNDTGQHQNVVGEYFVGARRENGLRITTCPSWDASAATPSFWPDFATNGHLTAASVAAPTQPAGAVAAETTLAPGQSRTVRFYVTWAMPHVVTVQQRTIFGSGTDQTRTDVAALFDNNPSSRWATQRPMQPGDNLVIDLGKTVTPTHVTLDSGKAGSDYPRGLRVEVSDDRKTWKIIAERDAASLTGSTQAVALTPTPGRYLRLTNLGADNFLWWSIYGLTVHVQGQPAPLALTADAATAYLVRTEHRDIAEDVGHYWQNWWHGASEIAAYADKNADTLLARTRAWQDPVTASNLPFWLKLKLINCAFPLFSNTILTRDGRFSVLESPIDMGGALGTMDQRMASHAFYTAFFPELDRAELEMYATCQQPDGRITHFDGNIHEVVGRPDVGYGITDWPDLSCSWIMQAVKLYRWTGDRSFLDRMQPHITSAMDWLERDGVDDDLIPAGGSTYDYEQLPRGAFIYSASCYLGALRAASAVSDPAQAGRYDKHLADVQQSVMRDLWNGTFFRKWKQPTTGRAVEDSFVANLAGDWLARLTGLPRTLSPDIIHQSIAQTIARHQKPFFPVPPMQVTPEGKLTTSACYMLQHEPYLGCEAIYENYVDDGLETLHRVYLCSWELNHSPWDQSLAYDAPGGSQGGLVTYMTCPTSWFVLDALAGTSLDLPHGVLYISPRLPTTMSELHIPVYLSRFWGWLDYVPAQHHLSLRVDKVFPADAALQKTLFHAPGMAGDAMPDTLTLKAIAADGDAPTIPLPQPFAVRPSATLDLSPLLGGLNLPKQSETVNFQIKATITRPGLPSDHWTLTDNLHDSPELAAAYGGLALDGDPNSRWTTNRSMQPGDQLTLDMGALQQVARIVLDSTKSPNDYPRGYTVAASVDGRTWQTVAQATAAEVATAQQNGVLTITFPATAARYLRITNRGAAAGLFWSVHELSVYGP